jgi:hypothetical protein
MKFLKSLADGFMYPGTVALRLLGVTVEEDSGIFRSLFNSFFWGAIALFIAIAYFT